MSTHLKISKAKKATSRAEASAQTSGSFPAFGQGGTYTRSERLSSVPKLSTPKSSPHSEGQAPRSERLDPKLPRPDVGQRSRLLMTTMSTGQVRIPMTIL